jgi:hypothetical protein
LYSLLTIPIRISAEERSSLLQVALEQKRVSFLNNERIANILNHMFYYDSTVNPCDAVYTQVMPYYQQLKLLAFQPFRFYVKQALYFTYLVFSFFFHNGSFLLKKKI